MDRRGSLERYHPPHPRRNDDDLSDAFGNMRVDDGYNNIGRGKSVIVSMSPVDTEYLLC